MPAPSRRIAGSARRCASAERAAADRAACSGNACETLQAQIPLQAYTAFRCLAPQERIRNGQLRELEGHLVVMAVDEPVHRGRQFFLLVVTAAPLRVDDLLAMQLRVERNAQPAEAQLADSLAELVAALRRRLGRIETGLGPAAVVSRGESSAAAAIAQAGQRKAERWRMRRQYR